MYKVVDKRRGKRVVLFKNYTKQLEDEYSGTLAVKVRACFPLTKCEVKGIKKV